MEAHTTQWPKEKKKDKRVHITQKTHWLGDTNPTENREWIKVLGKGWPKGSKVNENCFYQLKQ